MTQIDRSFSGLDAVFATHEHSDHIRGIGPLLRKHEIPFYATKGTWRRASHIIGNINEFLLEKGKVKVLDKKILLLQPVSKLSEPPKGRQPKHQKQTDAEKNLERIKKEKERKKKRDADREQMKQQRVKWVQVLDLDKSFKSNLMEKLKEVENFEKWN